MLRLKTGDEVAFSLLYGGYRKKIFNYCFRMLQDPERSEEVTQEVFLRVYRSAGRFEPVTGFSAWVFRIATNLCLNELRRQRFRHLFLPFGIVRDERGEEGRVDLRDRNALTPQEELERHEERSLVIQGMKRLPGKQKAALVLRILHGFSYREISYQLNLSEAAVKSLVHRGRERLKKLLAKDIAT